MWKKLGRCTGTTVFALLMMLAGCGLEPADNTPTGIAGEEGSSATESLTDRPLDLAPIIFGTPKSSMPPVETGFTLFNGSNDTVKIDVLHAGRVYWADFDFQPGSSVTFRADCGSFGFRQARSDVPLWAMHFLAEPGDHFLCGQNVTLTMTGIAGREFIVDVVHEWPNGVQPPAGSQ